METIKVTLEIPLTEELLRRVDAAAKWMETTRQEFIEQALDTGVLHSIENSLTEGTSTLSVDSAIRIAKIIATAPVARMPMITQLFHQASVNLEGLEELMENSAASDHSRLIDTAEFIQELTEGRETTERGYLFTPDEFNQFCLARDLSPRLVKRHLYLLCHHSYRWYQPASGSCEAMLKTKRPARCRNT